MLITRGFSGVCGFAPQDYPQLRMSSSGWARRLPAGILSFSVMQITKGNQCNIKSMQSQINATAINGIYNE